jgi:KEOPS complex subunit Pcc1
MIMKAKCKVEIEFPDERSLEAAVKAAGHEGGLNNRSAASMEKNGKTLSLSIEAEDVVALRASMNAFMRAFQVFEAVGTEEGKKAIDADEAE